MLRYLRAQLRSSRVYGADTLPGLPAFNARVKGAVAAAGQAIPVAVQYHPYASIRPAALQNNLLRVQNEQVYDVAGRPQSPYQTNVLFAAAPALSYSRTNTVSFLFRRNLYLASNGAVPSLSLDFADGRGYQPVTWGQPLATTYATAGAKRVKVKAVFSTPQAPGGTTARNGTSALALPVTVSYESHFDFQVQAVVAAARYDNSVGFPWYCQINNFRPGAEISVRYGRGHGAHVVKPFIVVEQYNIARAAPNLVRCNNANNTVEKFLPMIDVDFFTPGAGNFNDQLEAAGYDLIYVDFKRNTDDITRNAELVERLIQEVETWKSISRTQFGLTTYPNVVMGMSMGGLIARYALAEMTKTPTSYGPPNTRLLVLHDSPQRGAYNPLGLQSFTRSCDVPLNLFEFLKLRDFKADISDALNVLDEPATQQLAILSAFNGRGTDIRANTFIDGVYKNKVEFSPSDPQPGYQIVATSDGSQCGRGSGAPLGVQLSSADTYTRENFVSPLSYLSYFSLGVRGAAYGLPAYGQQAVISRMRVYIEYRICIGIGGNPLACIPIRYDLLNESATSPPNTLPYETLPGGTTNLYAESGDCSTTTGIPSSFLQTSLYNGPICFVPTYSALDVPTVTPATAFAKYVSNLTDNPSLPRVSRYIAQANPAQTATEYNLRHLTFTPRNSEWIFNEMQRPTTGGGNNLACTTECLAPGDVVIGGPGTLCGTQTYTSPLHGAGVSYTWTTSPAGAFSPAAGTDETFTTSNGVADGYGTITLQIGGDCPRTLTKDVKVGKPDQPGISLDLGCTDFGGTATIVNFDPTLSYTATTTGSVYFFGTNRRSIPVTSATFNIKTGGEGSVGTIGLLAHNGCGDATGGINVEQTCAGFAYTLAPNPASTDVEVTETARRPGAAGGGIGTVRVYDGFGRLQIERPGNGAARLRLHLGTLPDGLYIVHVLRGRAVVSRLRLQVLR